MITELEIFQIEHINVWVWVVLSLFIMMYIFKKIIEYMVPYRSIMDFPRNYVGMNIHGIVKYVPDGDGFNFIHVPRINLYFIKWSHKTIKVRLSAIDAPEYNRDDTRKTQKYGLEAKEYLEYLVINKTVSMQVLGIDKYDRLLVMVFVEGANINEEMVKAGWAVIYKYENAKYGNCLHRFVEAQHYAKRCKIGMWKDDNVQMPGNFKKNLKNSYVTGSNNI